MTIVTGLDARNLAVTSGSIAHGVPRSYGWVTSLPYPASNGKPVGDNPASSLARLIQEAETLCETLTNARASVTRLITGLRRHRKQSRLLSETLKSLRQLKLTETAE
ncbi:MAG: hypothetical protein ACLP7Q_04820 [Isosphaeraceae bacterium]